MLIGLCGRAGAGKSLAAEFIKDLQPRVKFIHLSDPIKQFCQQVFEFTDDQLYGPSENRNAIDPRYNLSPRECLQTLGTDWGRKHFHDAWINMALKRAKREINQPHIERANAHKSLYSFSISPTYTIVIPDVRFVNELKRIREEGGVNIRLTRKTTLKGKAAKHKSEEEIDSPEAKQYIDYTIHNTKSKTHLKAALEGILNVCNS